jgi:hypothetical protein
MGRISLLILLYAGHSQPMRKFGHTLERKPEACDTAVDYLYGHVGG